MTAIVMEVTLQREYDKELVSYREHGSIHQTELATSSTITGNGIQNFQAVIDRLAATDNWDITKREVFDDNGLPHAILKKYTLSYKNNLPEGEIKWQS